LLIAEAKLGFGHLHHFAHAENVVECNDYPLLWPGGLEAERRQSWAGSAPATT
jgi:hypothetical protein